jgi:proteic killer suppression protein
VIRSFADQATSDVYVGVDSKIARRIPKSIWPVVRRKLDLLHRTRSPGDLRLPSGNRLETLKG